MGKWPKLESHSSAPVRKDDMLTQDRLSLRDTADALELGSVRLLRLGRYLHIVPGDKCIPVDVVIRAKAEADGEQRYRMVLGWLLEQCAVE
jgi:hypothetical protein